MMINNIAKKPILIEAPSWKRIFAFFVDLFILNNLILFPFQRILARMLPDTESFSSLVDFFINNQASTIAFYWIGISMGIIALLYFALFESKYAQTPGKMLMKIFSVTLKSNQKELQTMRFTQAMKRSISIVLLYLFPLLFLIDVVYMFFNPKKQRLFEKISQTQTLQIDFI